jgi:hypothetical protein
LNLAIAAKQITTNAIKQPKIPIFKEPVQPLRVLAGDRDIHSPQERDQMAWDEDGSENSDFTKTSANSKAHPEIGSAELGQEICPGPTKDLINMLKSGQRRDQMVLGITEI